MPDTVLPLVVQIERTTERVADTVAFNRSPVRIGRNPLNDLQLEEGFVSQWHSVVRIQEGRTTYLDLGSTNRTLINGQPIDRNVEVVVDENTDVRIGTLRLHFLRVPAGDELFGKRRKSAFATGIQHGEGDVASTLFLGEKALQAMRAQLAQASAAAGPSAPAPAAAPAPSAAPSGRASAMPNAPVRQASARPQPEPVPQAQAAAPSVMPRSGAPQASPSGRAPAVQASGDPLLDTYRSYRAGFSEFFASIRRELEATAPERREEQALLLLQRFPELQNETLFRDYLRELKIDPLRVGQSDMEDWLRRLTDGLFPPKGWPINIAMAMERVGEILEVFAQAFIELRRAQEQFSREMSLERYADESTLQKTDDPRVLIAYLLNPHKDGAGRTTELTRALADFTVHQVALVSGVVEGARAVLEGFAEPALEKSPDPKPGSAVLLAESVSDKMFPYQARKLWRRFLAHHQDLIEGDRFTQQLFGRAFARRYYLVTGSQSPTQK